MSPSAPVPLVDLLREELSGYGALLAQFESQQEHLWRREIDAVIAGAAAIEASAEAGSRLRREREQWVRDFAADHDRPTDITMLELLDLFPADQRALLEALITEINQLIRRLRRCARHNQLVMRRALELHQEILAQFNPRPRPRTYSPRGAVPPPLAGASTLHTAV